MRARVLTISLVLTCGACQRPREEPPVPKAEPARPPSPPAVGWRGDGTGRYPTATPPLHWSETTGIAWKTPLPARGGATPVLVGDRLFVTAEPDELLALSVSDGHILWQRHATVLDALSEADRKVAEGYLK